MVFLLLLLFVVVQCPFSENKWSIFFILLVKEKKKIDTMRRIKCAGEIKLK